MWLLTHETDGDGGDVFNAGQIVLSDRSISRQHCTIEIAHVPSGEATDPESRAKVTVTDLKTRLGTTVNGKKMKDESLDLLNDDNEVKVGKENTLRIRWHPVVFSFHFTKPELEQGAVATIQAVLEPLDIKFFVDAKTTRGVTHVVEKTKNRSRVVEALVNGLLVVHQTFVDAIAKAAKPTTDSDPETSPLELDFAGNWPDATKYLPTGEGWSDALFAPNPARREIFDGYTFIFYDAANHAKLLPAITSAKGKALLCRVVPGQTDVDEFIRYVKSNAGEKGLGEFEDGSEGKGVAVVRHLPKDENEAWYLEFFNEVAQRLDHRPIDSRDFLAAVLDVNPAMLRRPLEPESTPQEPATQSLELSTLNVAPENLAPDNASMEVDQEPSNPVVEESPSPPPARKPRKGRSQAQSKFKGFTIESDDSDDGDNAGQAKAQSQGAATQSQGMFVTQQSDIAMRQAPGATTTLSQRKRPAPEPEQDLMDSLAPTVARFKRQRLETGQDPLPAVERSPSPEPEPPAPAPAKRGRAAAASANKKPARKGKKGADDSGDELLDQLVQTGQEEEANRQAEEHLVRRQLFENEIDFGTIREATNVHTVAIRRRLTQGPEQGDGRWDPHWNGLKNFKKFRSQKDQDAPRVRVQPKKILSLQAVRFKEYGLSDDYWLQDEDKKKKKGRSGSTQTQTQDRTSQRAKPSQLQEKQVLSDNSDHEVQEDDDDVSSLPSVMDAPPAPKARSRKGKAAERASQQTTQQARPTTRGKRPAAEAPVAEKPAKRSRIARASKEASEDEEDDSEDDGGIGFRFGKRK